MVDLLSKISSYDLFNYLLTGIIFVILADKLTHYSFIQPDIKLGLFLYYFIGLMISRIGSLVVDPVLKYISFIKFEPYPSFLLASEKDKKIELLVEVNNTYRTFSSLFAILGLLRFYEWIQGKIPVLSDWNTSILIFLLLLIFLFSYRKQTSCLTKRIIAKE